MCPIDNCDVQYSHFSSDSVRSWCPDEGDANSAYIDSFLGNLVKVQNYWAKARIAINATS